MTFARAPGGCTTADRRSLRDLAKCLKSSATASDAFGRASRSGGGVGQRRRSPKVVQTAIGRQLTRLGVPASQFSVRDERRLPEPRGPRSRVAVRRRFPLKK